MRDWVKCPICLEDGAERTREFHTEGAYINCVNLSCGSNGGDNFEGVKYRFYNEGIEDAAKVVCGGCARGLPIRFQRHQTLPPSASGGSYPCVASRITNLMVQL